VEGGARGSAAYAPTRPPAHFPAVHRPTYTAEPCEVDVSLNLAAHAAACSNSSQLYGVVDISINSAALASAYSIKSCGVDFLVKLASLATAYWAELCVIYSESGDGYSPSTVNNNTLDSQLNLNKSVISLTHLNLVPGVHLPSGEG